MKGRTLLVCVCAQINLWKPLSPMVNILGLIKRLSMRSFASGQFASSAPPEKLTNITTSPRQNVIDEYIYNPFGPWMLVSWGKHQYSASCQLQEKWERINQKMRRTWLVEVQILKDMFDSILEPTSHGRLGPKYVKLSLLKRLFQNKWAIVKKYAPAVSGIINTQPTRH